MTQKVSTEGCSDCGAAASQTPGGVPSNSMPGINGGETDSFTYDEGKGVKDKIVLTGPMSEQYTQALAVYFAKRTLDAEGNEVQPTTPAQVAQNLLTAQESIMMMEDEAMRKAFDEVHQAAPVDHLSEFYDFAQIENDPDGVTVSGYFMSDSVALQPEVVEQVEQHVRDSNKRVIVVVVGASQGVTRGTGFRQKFIEIDTAGQQTMFDQGSEQAIAREHFYDAKGITVVNGVLGLFKELQRTAKRPAKK